MIRLFLNLCILLIIIDTLLTYVPRSRSWPWAIKLRMLSDRVLAPIRKALGQSLPFDVAPLVLILAIRLLQALW